MEIKSQLNYLRISPRKVRLAANMIKGLSVQRAELEMRHLFKRASLPILKLLRSALASAKHNFQLDGKGLYVKNILVNEGPALKRFRPRAFGRAAMIRKRSSHLTLILSTGKTSPAASPQRRKEAPLVREVTAEDIKPMPDSKRQRGGREAVLPRRGKTADFVRRVFRRKAI